jgi:hypothetical protein
LGVRRQGLRVESFCRLNWGHQSLDGQVRVQKHVEIL